MLKVLAFDGASIVAQGNFPTTDKALEFIADNPAPLVELWDGSNLRAVSALNFWLDEDDFGAYVKVGAFHASLNVGRFVPAGCGLFTVDGSAPRMLSEWVEEMETFHASEETRERKRLYDIARREGMTGANAAWLVKALLLGNVNAKHLGPKARESARSLRNLPNLHKQPLGKGRHYLETQNEGIRKIIFDK